MRFKHFISEGRTPEQFSFEQFFSDCAPFLRQLHGMSSVYLPKHGTQRAPDDWGIIEHTKRREPRDTATDLHIAANELFSELFGWEARSDAIFMTGDKNRAGVYGVVCAIFPIGKFDTLWSPHFEDLYLEYSEIKDYLRGAHLRDAKNAKYTYGEVEQLAREKTMKKAQASDWRFNKDLREGLESGNEIMLRAERYYLITNWSPLYTELHDALRDKGIIR